MSETKEITTLNAPEAEEYLLNACCKDYSKVFPLLPDNFCDMLNRPDNKTIFTAIKKLVKKGIQPDVGTVTEEIFSTSKQVDTRILIRDPFKIISLKPEQIQYYAKRVTDCFINRQLLSDCQQTISDIRNGVDPKENAGALMASLCSINRLEKNSDTKSTKDLIHDYLDKLKNDEIQQSRLLFPYSIMNAITGGLGEGELMFIAGRPGMGKTLVLMNIILNLAKQGKRISYFDMELSKEVYARRAIATLSHIKMRHLIYSKEQLATLPQKEQSEFFVKTIEADYIAGEMEDIIRHERRRNKEDICSTIQADNLEKPIDLVVIDHIGRIPASSKYEDKKRTISEATKDIHDVCKKIGVPLIIATQVNRNGSDDTKPPTMDNLKDSGTLEEDGDIVAILYRPYYYTKAEEEKHSLQIHFNKMRNDDPATCTMRVDMGHHTMFDGKRGICRFNDFLTEPLDKKAPEAKEAKSLFAKK